MIKMKPVPLRRKKIVQVGCQCIHLYLKNPLAIRVSFVGLEFVFLMDAESREIS
jgi:hypothetical protein